MFGLGWKVSILFAIAGVGTWVWMDYRLTQEKLRVAELTTANVILKENEAKLLGATEKQQKTVDALIEESKDKKERILALTQQNEIIQQDAKKFRIEIEGLRQTEAAAALHNPYNRGIAADIRMRKLMQSISGPAPSPKS